MDQGKQGNADSANRGGIFRKKGRGLNPGAEGGSLLRPRRMREGIKNFRKNRRSAGVKVSPGQRKEPRRG